MSKGFGFWFQGSGLLKTIGSGLGLRFRLQFLLQDIAQPFQQGFECSAQELLQKCSAIVTTVNTTVDDINPALPTIRNIP